jgi:hypothetical protein
MGDWEVRRWRRYGKDRLYVHDADGTAVGWRDLLTGEDHVDSRERLDEFRFAVESWRASQSVELTAAPPPAVPPRRGLTRPPVAEPQAPVAQGPTADPEPSIPAAPPMWDDLAAHRAGEMARQQALALKQAAPVRTFVARVFGVHTDERAWRIGADGEEKVAARLAKLAKKDPRWKFLHAIPVGENGSDIDHLVIGPGGVFSLNAKHHPGARIWVRDNAFRVNGQQQPYIRNSRHEALRAGRYLTAACGFPVEVTGMVVPVGADDLTIKQQPADVVVVNRMALPAWLRRRPDLLSDAVVDAVFEAARRSTTWRRQG